MDRVIIVGKTYKHFKGQKYKVLCIAKDSESEGNDLKEVVVYEALYGKHLIWTRPYDMFNSKVDKNLYPDVDQEYRFELVND
ncbi:MAG: DUF1653 domain-containing protein [Bacilli bacterium]|nr:DUF1653 domain-containing protein [Bacilli bacterium]